MLAYTFQFCQIIGPMKVTGENASFIAFKLHV